MSMKLRALVIDDSGVMRKMVMKALTEANLAEFEFIEAEDGQITFEKLQASEIDIAFVDWNMPNMTGIDFVRAVRKWEKSNDHGNMPLVMVTSEKTMGKIQEALDEAGADGFITKPFTAEEMKVKLKKHTDKAQLLRLRKERAKNQAAGGPPSQPESSGWFRKMFS